MTKVLFICKKSHYHFGYSPHHKTTGLKASAFYCSDVLNRNGIPSELVIVNDNNEIDREVTRYRPRFVIIEALWVVPEKFEVLQKLHPDVTWIVRVHSEVPFLATEGVSIDWISRYSLIKNVLIAANSDRGVDDLRTISLGYEKIIYLPNCFLFDDHEKIPPKHHKFDDIHIGCFGAIRPLKNQLIQALAAIRFANDVGKVLTFHMNGDRVEGVGEPVKRNIQALFENASPHKVRFHPWYDHLDFLKVLARTDIGMQVSMTESFNHVAADSVALGLPIVVSPEIRWASFLFKADPTSSASISDRLWFAWGIGYKLRRANFYGLKTHSRDAERAWVDYFS